MLPRPLPVRLPVPLPAQILVWLGMLASGGAAAPALPFSLADDFAGYAPGSAGEPNWEVDHFGFAVEGQALRAEVAGERGVALWRAAPAGRALTVEAGMSVTGPRGKEWKTAGIGIWTDEANFWHLALVESPSAAGARHYVELSEMLDGVWNAHCEAATRLSTLEESGPFAWEAGRSYRLRLALTREAGGPVRLTGEIYEGETRAFMRKPSIPQGFLQVDWRVLGQVFAR